MLTFTSPAPATAALKNQVAFPLACLIQPLLPLKRTREPRENSNAEDVDNELQDERNPQRSPQVCDIKSSTIARCEQCFGYINPYVTITRKLWQYAFRSHTNDLLDRYHQPDDRHSTAGKKFIPRSSKCCP